MNAIACYIVDSHCTIIQCSNFTIIVNYYLFLSPPPNVGAGHADTNLDIDEAVIPPDSKYLPRSPTRPYPVAVAAPTRPPYQQQQQQPSTTTTLSSSEHPSTPGHLPYESSPRQPPHHPRGAVPLSQPQQLSQGTGGGGGAGGVTGFGMGGDLTDGGIATDYTCTTDESYPPSVAPSSVGSPYNHRRHAMLLQEHDGGGGGGGGGLDPRSVASPGENPYVEMHPVYAEIKKHPYRGRGGGGGRSREHSRSRERSREMSPRLTPASPTHSETHTHTTCTCMCAYNILIIQIFHV